MTKILCNACGSAVEPRHEQNMRFNLGKDKAADSFVRVEVNLKVLFIDAHLCPECRAVALNMASDIVRGKGE